jgi:2-dehydropantoate 2-reductase
MKILVVGAGSVGGYFGGRLAQAGRDVTFLVRPGRAERLRSRGLEIVSPHGDVTLVPKLVTAAGIAGHFDAIILSVKAFALYAVLGDLAPAIGPETMIFPVLNGMKHVDVLVGRFGTRAVAGCACKVATILDDEGRIVQLTKFQDFAYGELDGQPSARMDRFDQAMKAAPIGARLSPVIGREMWEKWILLATVGGITCLMRGAMGEVEAAPGGREFILRFFDEVVSVVAAVGTAPSDAFLVATRAQITEKGSAQTSSMYRDVQKGRPVEADQILGDLLARGRAAGLALPLIAAAYAHLSVYAGKTPA